MEQHSLTIPSAVSRDENSVEMIRCWVAGGKQWTSINSDLFENRSFDEEWAWGLFLADTTRHISNSIALKSGKEQSVIIERIIEALKDELSKPTSTASGGHVG